MNSFRPDTDMLAGRVNELRVSLQKLIPAIVADKSGSKYMQEEGEIHLPHWDLVLHVSLNEYVVRNTDGNELPSFLQTLVLYYLFTADGTPSNEKWVSFSDLPDGRVYDRAFQVYTGDELAKYFGMDLEAYKVACVAAGGTPVDVGGVAFMFWAFPRVQILVNYWAGDDDFPSSCKLLFDDSVSHYLPTDACAILGRHLTRKIVRKT